MGIQCGIVGLPNVGKSTLFNALTQAGIDAENFPFCTIEPNTGVVSVPDPRQGQISGLVNPERTIPATMESLENKLPVKKQAVLGDQPMPSVTSCMNQK